MKTELIGRAQHTSIEIGFRSWGNAPSVFGGPFVLGLGPSVCFVDDIRPGLMLVFERVQKAILVGVDVSTFGVVPLFKVPTVVPT